MSSVSNDFNVNVFIRRLQDILDERDMKQKELADLIGVSEVTISRYMNGERVPRIDIISSLAKALNTTTDYLLGNSDIKTLIQLAGLFDVSIDYLIGWIPQKDSIENNDLKYDESLLAIAKAKEKMSDEDKIRMMNMLKLMFEEYFID